MGTCFRCGKTGHIRHNCPQGGSTQQGHAQEAGNGQRPIPGLCPRCKKGRHWAIGCRSVKDINGQPLVNVTMPKNGQLGPRPQGPQIYGAMEDQSREGSHEQWPTFRHPKDRGELLQVQQDWTFVPPPDSY